MQELDKWQKELEQLSNYAESAVNKKLFKYYRQALIEIKKEMKVFIENYENLSFSKRLEAERLLQNGKQIDMILRETYQQANKAVEDYAKTEAERGYYGTWYAMEGAHNLQLDMNMLPEKYIKQLVHHPVKGKVFSKRLYKYRDRLAKETTNALLDAARKGKSYAVAAKQINELTEASYKQAFRIARTEGARVQSRTKQRSYVEAKKKGVDLKKKWLSTLDKVTRDSHQYLDGQVVEIEEQFETKDGYKADGPRLFGVASEDIHCRCTTTTEVEGFSPELRRDNETGDTFPYKNYNEWKKDRIDKMGQKAWDIEVSKAKNASRDSDQFSRYKRILGKNVPKTLDAFQELKYSNNKEWANIQQLYKDRKIQSQIQSGEYNLSVHNGRQGKHILNHNNYIEGRSYLLDKTDSQALVNKYAGTGELIRRRGKWTNKELIIQDEFVGVNVYQDIPSQTVHTNRFIIHYSKKGTHIVPTMRGADNNES
ncbi:hypothetical protein JYK21_07495 [Ralstonia pickettii]|nr:hypothetical protein [Ralstonia pickettii]